jgi:alkylation response protein AidB-like acyl-CoA dehydrogenase
MDLELTDEQTLLAESVQQLLSRSPGAGAWPALVDFGVLSIAVGEDEDVGAVELALVARAVGEHLESVPLIDTAAALYAARFADGAVRDLLADRVTSLALLEPGGSWELEDPSTSIAIDTGGRASIDGHKAATHAEIADALIVLGDDDGSRRLAIVPRAAAGVTAAPVPWIDESLQPATVAFDDVAVDVSAVLSPEATEAVLQRLLAIGAVMAAAEAAGAAAAVMELARQYATERRQFGRTIGSFQALRHLLADMYVKQDSSWSTVLFAAAALEDGSDDALRTASIAKAYVSRAAQDVAEGALQVFGGIAFTAEHPAHRFLRRILARGQQFGDARHHERALGRALVRAAQPTGAVT